MDHHTPAQNHLLEASVLECLQLPVSNILVFPYDKLLMDLMYISHPSLLEDLMIMFATVKILFMPESTEGVEEGQVNALGKMDKEGK